ncbi:MAG: hypothetical protein AAB340_02360 [Patescibacteria group bacterium]
MKNKKKVTTIDGLARMINSSFQDNQEYMDKKFEGVDKKFGILTGKMNKNFHEVKKQIDNISKNTVDVIHQEDFNKLESRVEDVEEVLHITGKK